MIERGSGEEKRQSVKHLRVERMGDARSERGAGRETRSFGSLGEEVGRERICERSGM
jgi:hypothetical protein